MLVGEVALVDEGFEARPGRRGMLGLERVHGGVEGALGGLEATHPVGFEPEAQGELAGGERVGEGGAIRERDGGGLAAASLDQAAPRALPSTPWGCPRTCAWRRAGRGRPGLGPRRGRRRRRTRRSRRWGRCGRRGRRRAGRCRAWRGGGRARGAGSGRTPPPEEVGARPEAPWGSWAGGSWIPCPSSGRRAWPEGRRPRRRGRARGGCRRGPSSGGGAGGAGGPARARLSTDRPGDRRAESDSVPSVIPVACESRIERVVVYARGAVVTRAVTLPGALPEGPVVIRLGGVTARADGSSLRALGPRGAGGHGARGPDRAPPGPRLAGRAGGAGAGAGARSRAPPGRAREPRRAEERAPRPLLRSRPAARGEAPRSRVPIRRRAGRGHAGARGARADRSPRPGSAGGARSAGARPGRGHDRRRPRDPRRARRAGGARAFGAGAPGRGGRGGEPLHRVRGACRALVARVHGALHRLGDEGGAHPARLRGPGLRRGLGGGAALPLHRRPGPGRAPARAAIPPLRPRPAVPAARLPPSAPRPRRHVRGP